MRASHFGQMFIIIGVFLTFVMLFIADWEASVGFMQNIRYAILYRSDMYSSDAIIIRLGPGLILPLALMAIGLMITREIISERLLSKIIPFIKCSSDNIE